MPGFHLNRRHFLGLSGSAARGLPSGKAFATLPTDKPLHGLSAFGELKYPPDFTHFDYVNPDAPKGGTFTLAPSTWVWNQNTETFNTLNTLAFKGDAPPRMELTFDTLMVSALDEPDAVYGLIAESVTLSKDRQTCLFKLRKEARFHDGSPIEAKDVVFTYETLKEKGHPQIKQTLAALEAVKETSKSEVQMHFAAERGPNAILDAVTLPILSKDWFRERNFDAASLEPILGSGAYRVGKISAGQAIEYDRVDDYWARDLPVQRGSSNFDRIRIEFYRDRQPEFEAFKRATSIFDPRAWQRTGPQLMISLRFSRTRSSSARFRGKSARSCRPGRSTSAVSASAIRACAKRSISASTSSGPTQICSMTPISGRNPTSTARTFRPWVCRRPTS